MRSAALPASGAVPTVGSRRCGIGGKVSPFSTFSTPREHGMSKPNAFGLPHTERRAMGSERRAPSSKTECVDRFLSREGASLYLPKGMILGVLIGHAASG